VTPDFLETVLPLYNRGFGTEQMAPLLHALVRFHRPQIVVELGYGYTTPFIAQALADNTVNAAAEWKTQLGGGTPYAAWQLYVVSCMARAMLYARARCSGAPHLPWYAERSRAGMPTLHVIDDGSQRTHEMTEFAKKMESTLQQLDLDGIVRLSPSLDLRQAHTMFEPDSLGMVWNDAQWDPTYLSLWWPLLKRDGGLLLLHNVIGQPWVEGSRWCWASPRRVMRQLFPGEKFEFITLLEPHKAYQGSVAMLRRLDPEKRPRKFKMLWGGKDEDEGVVQFFDLSEALGRR
jgi:predicted O-methyltransferase YrrM